MLSRLQQQHVQSVTVDNTLWKDHWNTPQHMIRYPPIHHTTDPQCIPEISVYILNTTGEVITKPDGLSPKEKAQAYLDDADFEYWHISRIEPNDFVTRAAFYDWLQNCTCTLKPDLCDDCLQCQGCCACHSLSYLLPNGTVAGGWGHIGDAHIGEASHPGPRSWLPALFSPSVFSLFYCCRCSSIYM